MLHSSMLLLEWEKGRRKNIKKCMWHSLSLSLKFFYFFRQHQVYWKDGTALHPIPFTSSRYYFLYTNHLHTEIQCTLSHKKVNDRFSTWTDSCYSRWLAWIFFYFIPHNNIFFGVRSPFSLSHSFKIATFFTSSSIY